jgi:tetratricopeptide (TPR) repeat protein
MSRLYIATVFVFSIFVFSIVVSGCSEGDLKDDPRFRASPDDAALVSAGFMMPDAAEVDLVERMGLERSEYRASLRDLIDYYRRNGAAGKLAWAQREYGMHVQYRYLMPGEAMGSSLMATDSLEEADVVFDEAEKLYSEAGGLLIIIDEGKLRMSLSKYNEVIEKYPTSDKIDNSAYRAGRIYEHFKDYEIAAVLYQRVYQWNEFTQYPARFKAAYVMDRRLHMRKEALAAYQLSLEKESRYEKNADYAKMRIRKMSKQMGIDEAVKAATGSAGAKSSE